MLPSSLHMCMNIHVSTRGKTSGRGPDLVRTIDAECHIRVDVDTKEGGRTRHIGVFGKLICYVGFMRGCPFRYF